MLGNYVASPSHLAIVLNTMPKIEHRLKQTDINAADKMNFDAVLAVTNERLEPMLEKVPGSEGTRSFLKLMRCILHSFAEADLTPSKRIYLIWYAVFFLRVWKTWLLHDARYLAENFITSNAYTCVELNAHALVNAVVKCRNSQRPEDFCVWQYSSQPCESFFRKARSQSSTYCTVVNFSMLDFLHRAKRIQAQDDIAVNLQEKYAFARQKPDGQHLAIHLPSDEVIYGIICTARVDALNEIERLGMSIVDRTNIPICVPATTHQHDTQIIEHEEPAVVVTDTDTEIESSSSVDVEYDLFLLQQHNEFESLSQLQSVSDKMDSQCLKFRNRNGETFFIRKSTLCWLMNAKEPDQLSSDRIRRFITTRATNKKDDAADNFIKIGDWCEFDNTTQIGQVIGFKYLTGKRKERAYTLEMVPIKCPEGIIGKGVGVLCNWFDIKPGFVLEVANVEKHEFVDVKHFKSHLHKPKINTEMQLVMHEDDFVLCDE